MAVLDKIALTLVIIGALNWGCVGIFDFNFVNWITGDFSVIARIIYTLVGLAGVWSISLLFKEETSKEHATVRD